MNLKQIHKSLVSGQLTIFICILLAFGIRVLSHPDWSDLSFWGAFIFQVLTAILLLQMNFTFTIIKVRTMLPALFYLLFTSTSPTVYHTLTASFSAFCISWGFIFLFKSYQKQNSQFQALNISLILSAICLLWDSSLYLFPLFWIGLYQFRSLTAKSFFATIIGVLTVASLIFTWSIYKNDITLFLNFLPQKENFLYVHLFDLNVADWCAYGFLFIVFLIATFKIFIGELSEKTRTNSFLQYLCFTSIYLFVLLFLQSDQKANWALTIYIPLSLILSHLFTLSTKKSTIWGLIISILYFIGLYFWQLWEVFTA